MSLAACASHSTPRAADGPARAVPFVVRSAPGAGAPEYVQGVALVSPSAIEVLVTDARLADDSPRARLQRVRAELAEGDTARDWRATRSSDWVPVSRLRALAAAPGRDTVRFHLARTEGAALDARWLAFELAGEVAPPGLPTGPGLRSLHGQRGGLQAP